MDCCELFFQLGMNPTWYLLLLTPEEAKYYYFFFLARRLTVLLPLWEWG